MVATFALMLPEHKVGGVAGQGGLLILACDRDSEARPLLVSHLAKQPIGFNMEHARVVAPTMICWPHQLAAPWQTSRLFLLPLPMAPGQIGCKYGVASSTLGGWSARQ